MDAIAASGDANMLFVASAGNGNTDADANPSYPAAYELDNIISVAATDHNDDRASFSNWGLTSVDLAAPGVSILSTTPGDTYAEKNGTSMAAPHVSGAAAMAWSVAPAASYTVVRDALFDGVDLIASMDENQGSTTPVATGGRLNAAGMLQQLGMVASPSIPAAGSVYVDPVAPVSFVIQFSYPVDIETLDANGTSTSDLQVNQSWPIEYDWHGDNADQPDPNKVTYTFTSSPVNGQGVQTMHMPAGAVETLEPIPAGPSLREMNATFRYDALLMAVTGTAPEKHDVLTIPLTDATTRTFVVDFNETFDPTTLGPDDLVLSEGSVVGDPVKVDTDTVSYEIGNISEEGTLAVEMRAGALTDMHGNPMKAYSTSFDLDWDEYSYPTPLKAKTPAGSLIYDPVINGYISYAADSDRFTIDVDPDQTITLVVTPDAGLVPNVTLSDSGSEIASGSAATGNQAVIQTARTTSADTATYTIEVRGDGVTTGAYTLQLILNAAVENESHNGISNDGIGNLTQDIDASFISLGDSASRGAVMGTFEDNGCSLPDGGDYEACNVDYDFVDISDNLNATPILVGANNELHTLRKNDLGGFTFDFYNQTYNQVLVGSNGIITFELDRRSGTVQNNRPGNDNLTDLPAVATIAPLWDDLIIDSRIDPNDDSQPNDAAVYWVHDTSAGNNRLIIQYDKVRFTSNSEVGDITFQVILDANTGYVHFNYANLDTSQFGNGGEGASVGIKDTGNQGSNRLLLAFNDGPNNFVGTKVSTKIGTDIATPPTKDYYGFNLLKGERTTLALDLFGGNALLELHNASGQLAVGTNIASNSDTVIDGFIAPDDGTYYAVLTGDTRVGYNLLVTRVTLTSNWRTTRTARGMK